MIHENEVDGNIKYQPFTRKDLDKIGNEKNLPEQLIEEMKIVSLVIPFRTNNYVVDNLINWENIPDDPIFKINFPNKKMLDRNFFDVLKNNVEEGSTKEELSKILRKIYNYLNPHPGGQIDYNIPKYEGELLKGVQHKYDETVLVFPNEGQICHAFCTYCFRWAQFTGLKDLKIALTEPDKLVGYLQENQEIQDVLFTGGDPMIMRTSKLLKYIKPILEAQIPHLNSIRIGSKSLTYWPYRFVTDPDTDEILHLFKEISDSGLHLTFVANFNHPNELETEILRKAIQNIQSTGATIRTQTPLLRKINSNSHCLATLWKKQVNLGMVPYYLFVVRDTGAKHYFDIPLVDVYRIFNRAYRKISGICRTVKGPVMSTMPGKIHILGITNIGNSRIIVLKFIQGRNPNWIGRPFFAKYDINATWIDELEPAFSKKFFYEYDLPEYTSDNKRNSVKDLQKLDKKKEELEIKTET
jgi:KamA family protein